MKLFLLQLPIQGHDFFFSKENIPLAASYLQIYLVKTSETTLPRWSLDYMGQRYPSLPEIKLWQPPGD
jgi:hypothetical protein